MMRENINISQYINLSNYPWENYKGLEFYFNLIENCCNGTWDGDWRWRTTCTFRVPLKLIEILAWNSVNIIDFRSRVSSIPTIIEVKLVLIEWAEGMRGSGRVAKGGYVKGAPGICCRHVSKNSYFARLKLTVPHRRVILCNRITALHWRRQPEAHRRESCQQSMPNQQRSRNTSVRRPVNIPYSAFHIPHSPATPPTPTAPAIRY